MNDDARDSPRPIEWSVASRPMAGQTESGDHYLVEEAHNNVLVAVVDGLGHGAEAADAARQAVQVLVGHACEALAPLLQLCHEKLKRTRGVVLSLASFDSLGRTMTWLGVGNVEGVLLRADVKARPARESLLLRGGVVGYQLPPLRPAVLPVAPGDLLIFASDGIRVGFADRLTLRDAPRQIADQILADHGTRLDDALVLVVRYLGPTR